VRPGPKALRYSQDRLDEKLFISRLGIPVAPFAAIDSAADCEPALRTAGTPAILKTRRLGHDGKGQIPIRADSELRAAFDGIGRAPAVLEGFVSFAFEVSVLIVRGLAGDVRFYDIPVNQHREGILRVSSVPSALPDRHRNRAQDIAETIATALNYVGVLAVEM